MINFATNKSSTDKLYLRRKSYFFESGAKIGSAHGIDLWYGDKAAYGKVNTRGINVSLSESGLKAFPSDPNFLAIDFVVDAYEDFRNSILLAWSKKIISPENRFLRKLHVEKAWSSPEELYSNHMTTIYKLFTKRYLKTREDKPKNFEEFVELFRGYIGVAQLVPMTLSGFLNSRFCPLGVSGLIIEIADHPKSSDKIKFEKYLSKNAFSLYKNTARSLGFRIDYNAPWRLVADISSKEMKLRMNQEYSLDSNSIFFKTYFYKTSELDVDLIKDFLIDSYNKYAIANPFIKTVSGRGRGQDGIGHCIRHREPIDAVDALEKFDEIFWLEMYLHLRMSELGAPQNPDRDQKIMKKVSQIKKVLDSAASWEYIDRAALSAVK